MIIVIIIIIIVIITIQRGQKTCFTFPLKFKIRALTDHISEAVKDPFTFNCRIVIYVIIFPNLRQWENWSREKQLKEVAGSDGPTQYPSPAALWDLSSHICHEKADIPSRGSPPKSSSSEKEKSHLTHHPHPRPPLSTGISICDLCQFFSEFLGHLFYTSGHFREQILWEKRAFWRKILVTGWLCNSGREVNSRVQLWNGPTLILHVLAVRAWPNHSISRILSFHICKIKCLSHTGIQMSWIFKFTTSYTNMSGIFTL